MAVLASRIGLIFEKVGREDRLGPPIDLNLSEDTRMPQARCLCYF